MKLNSKADNESIVIDFESTINISKNVCLKVAKYEKRKQDEFLPNVYYVKENANEENESGIEDSDTHKRMCLIEKDTIDKKLMKQRKENDMMSKMANIGSKKIIYYF